MYSVVLYAVVYSVLNMLFMMYVVHDACVNVQH